MELFSTKNRAAARKTDPQTSQDAADRLNAVDGVTKQEREVLAALANYKPCTAKELGVDMAFMELWGVGGYRIPKDMIRKIIKIARKPHSRLKALVDDELVTVTECDGKRVYEIR